MKTSFTEPVCTAIGESAINGTAVFDNNSPSELTTSKNEKWTPKTSMNTSCRTQTRVFEHTIRQVLKK